MLKSLVFAKLPVNIRARIADLLWHEKNGSADILISILNKIINKIIQNSDPNVHKVKTAYGLMIECFKWKKDNAGIHDTNIAFAQYYERNSNELGNDDFRSIYMAVDYLNEAVKIYRNNKNKEQAERLQKTIIQLQSKLPQVMRTLTRTYDVSNLHEYIMKSFNGLSFQEAILLLTWFTNFREK